MCLHNIKLEEHLGTEAVWSHVALGYHLEWFIRGTPKPREEEKGILELREERKLQEQVGKDSTQVLSLKEKLEFTPKAALNRNRAEKS
ncbi:Small integral membrane protein 12 [Ataeniobius toweri]|uniref:Small integral membrane protein 12 n=1 Tax=Ataeniobius toweri TaxID=208326 RepID=A0ABU7BR70_9TELE|nr:Small integral membrane protein 12 [Ataeniobius toweri]